MPSKYLFPQKLHYAIPDMALLHILLRKSLSYKFKVLQAIYHIEEANSKNNRYEILNQNRIC